MAKKKVWEDFPDGVPFYTKGRVEIEVNFPGDKVCCAYCELFCRFNEPFKRYTCRLTREILLYPFDGVGFNCPLKIEEKNNDNL